MTVCIFTKFLGPTNTKAGRIKAYTGYDGDKPGRSITLEYDHELNSIANHVVAASRLAAKLDWGGEWFLGDAGDQYVFVRKAAYGFTVHEKTERHETFVTDIKA